MVKLILFLFIMEQDRNKLFERKIVEDIQHDEYDKLPIESFGKEMLLRMGWKENQPIRQSGPVEPIVFKPRNFRLGLGAEPLEDNSSKNLQTKSGKKAGYGIKVKITSGKHKGLKGKIVDKHIEYEYLNKIIKEKKKEILNVELKINKQIVKIEAEKIKLRKSHEKNKSEVRERSRSKSDSDKSRNKIEDNSEKIYFKKEKKIRVNLKRLTWVHPNTMVRIISKNSPYYNTKAVVIDLLDLFTFSLLTLNDNVLHNKFTEDDVETVIPKLNDVVIILVKEYRGENAKLLERNKKNNKVLVQLLNDFSIVELTQDDVSAMSTVKF